MYLKKLLFVSLLLLKNVFSENDEVLLTTDKTKELNENNLNDNESRDIKDKDNNNINEDQSNLLYEEEKNDQNKILNEMFDSLLEHGFDIDLNKEQKYESLIPLNKNEKLSDTIINEEFLSNLNDLDWQIAMEKMHHTLWYYWNNEFHKEYVQRMPSSLRQLRLISKKMGISSLLNEGALGETITQLNIKTKDADTKIKKLFKKLFINEKSFDNTEIKYKRSEEAVINMIIELKGYIRILLKLIDIKASQVGLLLLNKIQRKNYTKLSTNLNLFKSNIKNCPVHTAFSYRYKDENFDLLMHHEKGFGIWNTKDIDSKMGKLRDIDISRNIDDMIHFVFNEFIAPIALIGSSIEDITFINSSLIRTLWKNISTQYKIPLYTIFESITKATFFFIKQINQKIYKVNNSR